MAQKSHVPKFGNWDGDNVPYTAYFENARKEKVGGGVRMNPNDPEENPDAFLYSGFMNGSDCSNSSSAPLRKGLNKITAASEKHHQIEGQKQHQRNTSSSSSDHHRQQKSSVSQKSTTSETSSDKGNPPESVNHPRNLHQRKRSENKKSISENSHNFFPPSPSPSPGRSRIRGGTNASDDASFISASVPKFGAWDERDPRSAEGFTVIFNKVKEEKQIAASKFPPVQSQTSNAPEDHKREPGSKMRCCLF